MLQSNAEASVIVRQFGASACTDITGFGLLGHLLEMLRAASLGAELTLNSLPLLPGAAHCLRLGVLSSLHDANESNSCWLTTSNRHRVSEIPARILYDPQTAGGLLTGIDSHRADQCLSALRRAGYSAACIGQVLDSLPPGQVELI